MAVGSQSAEWSGKRWSELVPDLEAHRGHITGAWFKRHGITEQGLQKLDDSHLVRVYVGLWGTADGDSVTYSANPRMFTTRSLVGMTQGARKRRARKVAANRGLKPYMLHEEYRLGQKLRPCAGCIRCTCQTAFDAWPELGEALAKDLPTCDGSGVLPARKPK